MSENEQPIEWFLARDGKQHGPVTDLEMQKIVELGHLRPGDLVWRQGMPEWVQATDAFPPSAQKPAAQAAAQPQQQVAQQQLAAQQLAAQQLAAQQVAAQHAAHEHAAAPSAQPVAASQPQATTGSARHYGEQHRQPNSAGRQHHPQAFNETANPDRGANAAKHLAPQASSPQATSPLATNSHSTHPNATHAPVANPQGAEPRGFDPRGTPDPRGQRDVRAAIAAAQWDRPVQTPQRPQQQPSQQQPVGFQAPGFQPGSPTSHAPPGGNSQHPNSQHANAQHAASPQSHSAPIPAPMRPAAAKTRPQGTFNGQLPNGQHGGGPHAHSPLAHPPHVHSQPAAINLDAMRQQQQPSHLQPQLGAHPAQEFDVLDDAGASRRRFPIRSAVALILLFVLGGGAFALHKAGHLPLSLPFMTGSETNSSGDKAVAKMRAVSATAKEPPLAGFGSTAETVDGELQKSTLWQVVKREFPAWYGERIQDAVRLADEKKEDKEISTFMTAALIDLRRKNGVAVLAAGPERLKMVAASFVENLSRLAKHSTEACYGYISQGEGSPVIMEMLRSPEHTSSLQAQFKAIIEAAAEGRKLPKSYRPPSREDYDTLAVQLQARGWTTMDLQTFSDAKALARATPERVCQMVQDWFLAQLAITDEDVQMRLLAEALKPVVSG